MRVLAAAVLAVVVTGCGHFFPDPGDVRLPADARDYELECGTVPRAQCEARAMRIVVQKRAEQPGNRVVSVRIEDDRGSYTITFADGKTESMIVD
jgi:hypothetical protein